MATFPKFRLELFYLRSESIQALQDRVNAWLDAAAPDVQVIDRQVIPMSETADSYGAVETKLAIAIWYVAPPPGH